VQLWLQVSLPRHRAVRSFPEAVSGLRTGNRTASFDFLRPGNRPVLQRDRQAGFWGAPSWSPDGSNRVKRIEVPATGRVGGCVASVACVARIRASALEARGCPTGRAAGRGISPCARRDGTRREGGEPAKGVGGARGLPGPVDSQSSAQLVQSGPERVNAYGVGAGNAQALLADGGDVPLSRTLGSTLRKRAWRSSHE